MRKLKPIRLRITKICNGCVLALPISLTVPSPVTSQQGIARPPLVVQNDVGGPLRSRIHAIIELKQSARPVRIIGDVCYSTCTLYIGLAETCVSPDTVFGFHGPSAYGKPLDPASFERASQLIAAHYPEPVRNWYLKIARHEITGLFKVKGAVLINLGVAQCQSPAN